MPESNQFSIADQQEMLRLIAIEPLATLVVNSPSGLLVHHLPFVASWFETEDRIVLQAHIPRGGSLATQLAAATDGVAIFHGPQGYISPSYYATKKEHGRVVPTWNYQVVHAHGQLGLIEHSDWLLNQLHALTRLNERNRAEQWTVDDAPVEFTERMIKSLVGLELQVHKLTGKIKASQNQPLANQRSLISSLNKESPDSPFTEMMTTVLGA